MKLDLEQVLESKLWPEYRSIITSHWRGLKRQGRGKSRKAERPDHWSETRLNHLVWSSSFSHILRLQGSVENIPGKVKQGNI